MMEFPIIPCNLCGSQDNLQRQAIKSMLQDWEKQFPGRVESIFRSIANVSLSQLADTSLFPFTELRKDNHPGSEASSDTTNAEAAKVAAHLAAEQQRLDVVELI
jgi:tRNA 2-thiocytidine biosynthesis protein TtcA